MENGREREEIENELTLQDFQPFVSPPDFAISLSPIHLPGEIYIYIYLYTRVGDKMETKGGEEKGSRYIRTTRSRISISVYRLNETN